MHWSHLALELNHSKLAKQEDTAVCVFVIVKLFVQNTCFQIKMQTTHSGHRQYFSPIRTLKEQHSTALHVQLRRWMFDLHLRENRRVNILQAASNAELRCYCYEPCIANTWVAEDNTAIKIPACHKLTQSDKHKDEIHTRISQRRIQERSLNTATCINVHHHHTALSNFTHFSPCTTRT